MDDLGQHALILVEAQVVGSNIISFNTALKQFIQTHKVTQITVLSVPFSVSCTSFVNGPKSARSQCKEF